MILRIILAPVANNVSQTFQNSLFVYVGEMTYAMCGTIIVEHLAVYQIVASLLHLYMTRFWVVHDAAHFVPHFPVRNTRSCNENRNLFSSETKIWLLSSI